MQINKIDFSKTSNNSTKQHCKNTMNIELKPNKEYSKYSTNNLKANYLVNFKGNHISVESCKTDFGKIYHTTRFFREPKTDEIVQNYILNNFSNDPEINIVSGACSTGEEAKSYAMMLDDLGDKLHVFGFDISDDAILQAKDNMSVLEHYGNSTINDEGFLLDNYKGYLTPYQRKCRKKFTSYFDYFGKPYMMPLYSQSISEKTNNTNKNLKLNADLEEEYYYTCQSVWSKAGSFSNCEFKQGNVLNLEQLYKPNSVNVLLYRNALYHTLCQRYLHDQFNFYMKNDAEVQMKSIARQMNKVVKKEGLVVFGEKETKLQGIDSNVINKCMEDNGFRKFIHKGKYLDNVWVKVEDVE